MSILRNIYVALTNLRNAHVALSNLRKFLRTYRYKIVTWEIAISQKLPFPMSLSYQISCHMSLRPKLPHVALSMLRVV